MLAHGPRAEHVAAEYARLLRRWAHEHRRRGAATIRYIPAGGTPAGPAGGLVPKRHGTVAVGWS